MKSREVMMILRSWFGKYRQVAALLTIWFSLGFASVQAVGADAAWYSKQYGYYSEGEDISAVLDDFASAVGVPIRVSPNVSAKFSGSYTSITAKEFLDAVSRVYGLVWYYDGHILYIYQGREIVTKLITLRSVKPSAVEKSLKQLGIWDSRFGWRVQQDQNLVFVSGPPRYTELVEWVTERLDIADLEGSANSYVMRVFQLSHASVHDRTIDSRGGKVVIPGVVSVLKRLVGSHDTSATLGAYGGDALQDTVQSFKRGLQDKSSGAVDSRCKDVPVSQMQSCLMGGGMSTTSSGAAAKKKAAGGGRAYIEGDPRTNSLIVYDIKSRMPYYERIIEQLDTRSEQIEIEVSIIDIRTDKLKETGIDWEWRNDGRTGGFGAFEEGDYGEFTPQANTGSFLNSATQSYTTVLGSTADYFLARVRLLAGNGDAQVLAQPAVLTQNNMVAVLDSRESFFVRLEGEDEVGLEQITVGTMLKVKPHLFFENGVRKIRLDLNIRDGNQTGETVDRLPVIKESSIDTEAIVPEGSSLLVGGYYYDQRQKSVNKVPVLGDIPLLGHMFKNEKNESFKTSRMFMITPRLITQDSTSETDPTRVSQYRLKRDMDKEREAFSNSSHFEIMD